MVGLSIIPMLPTGFAFAVELTYPAPEGVSNGIMIIPSKIYGTLLGLAIGRLCKISPAYGTSLFVFNTVISIVMSFFI